MFNIQKLLDFVNTQIQFHAAKCVEFRDKAPTRSERHHQTAEHFRELHEVLTTLPNEAEELQTKVTFLHSEIDRLNARISGGGVAATDQPPRKKPYQLSLTFEDIKDLPDELLEELSIRDGDKMDFALQEMIEENGGVMSLDQILVALYRKTGVIHKRATLNARLYRMATRGMLSSFPKKKGVYATREITDIEDSDSPSDDEHAGDTDQD